MAASRVPLIAVDTPSDLSAPKLGKTELVYRAIKSDIETGALLPGEQLSEAMLVERTGASRTPVREALRRLAAEQLVDIEPRRAPTVARLSLQRARALFDYRRLLEPAAMKEIARRAVREPAVSAVFRELAEEFRKIDGRSYDEDFAVRFRELATRFDELVVANTPNDYVARAINELRPHTARLRLIAHADHARLAESVREHIEMSLAIADGDGDHAHTSATQHLFHVDQGIFKRLLRSQDGTAEIDLAN